MLELYQFEVSQYSEKVRLILDYKGLEYRKIEVTPGVGQLEIFGFTGQRQVPVLKDDDIAITDSTEIALYLERKYPDRPILPEDPVQRGQVLILEEWADEFIGGRGRKALIGALNQNQNFRTSILPTNVPDFVKTLVGAVPGDVLDILGSGIGLGGESLKKVQADLKQDLDSLCLILENRPYLVGDTPTLADLAVAGLSMILKFPAGDYLDIPDNLKGKGIPGLADLSNNETFFTWRDRLYANYRRTLGSTSTRGGSSPTSIEID